MKVPILLFLIYNLIIVALICEIKKQTQIQEREDCDMVMEMFCRGKDSCEKNPL